MDLDGTCGVAVVRVVADREDGGVNGVWRTGSGGRGWVEERGVAEVDPAGQVGVGGEAFGWDVGGGDPELDG